MVHTAAKEQLGTITPDHRGCSAGDVRDVYTANDKHRSGRQTSTFCSTFFRTRTTGPRCS